MKSEIKIAQEVFATCLEYGNCTRVNPISTQVPYESLNHTLHDTLSAREYIDLMDEEFGSCQNSGTPYAHVKEWIESGTLDYNCSYGNDIKNNLKLD